MLVVILTGLGVASYIGFVQLDPTEWTGLATWIYVGLTLGILIVLIYAAWAPLRSQAKARDEETKTRRAEYMIHLSERWSSPFLIASRKMINKVGNQLSQTLLQDKVEQRDEFYNLTAVAIFFEDLGIAVAKDWIGLKEAYDFLGPSVLWYYPLYESYIDAVQKKRNDKNIFKYFKLLAKRIELLQRDLESQQQRVN